MKKFYLLTKTLLVAALLCVGANAWATVTSFSEPYSSTSTTTGWSTSVSGRYDPVIMNEGDNYFLSVSQTARHNNGGTVTGNILSGKAAAGDDFTLMFDFRIATSNDQNPVEFNINDAANSEKIFSLVNTGKNSADWKINGSSTQIVTLAGTGSTDNNTPSTSTIGNYSWFSAKISRKGAVTYLTITKKSDASVVFARDVVASPSSTGGLGNIQFVTRRYNSNFAIDNIVVREIQDGDVPNVTYYTATFTETNSLKPTVKIYSNAGRTAEVTNGALTDETTYYYRAILEAYNNCEGSFTVDGADPSVSFTMTAKTRYTFKACAVNSVGGAVLETFYTDEDSYEGKKHDIVYPKYLTGTGSIVTYSKDNDTYGERVTASAANETHEVNYTAYDGVAYFVEVEDVLTDQTAYSSWNCSNGGAVRGFNSAKSIFTVPATGIYDVTYAACNNNVNYSMAVTLSKNETEIATKSDFQSVSINYIKTTGIAANTNISLAKDDVLKLTPNTTNAIVDYMLIELKSVPVTVGANGYTTFASPYALDLTDANRPEGLKAYKATLDGANLSFAKLNQTVPAGTGLLLLGETKGGSYNIPVVAAGDAITTAFTGVTTATAKQSVENTTYYFVMKKAASAESPLEFAPLSTSSSVTIPAGKAYITVPNSAFSGGARSLNVSFDDEVTGIKNLTPALSEGEGVVYNLRGQRVSAPVKGLYIVNGRKVVVK